MAKLFDRLKEWFRPDTAPTTAFLGMKESEMAYVDASRHQAAQSSILEAVEGERDAMGQVSEAGSGVGEWIAVPVEDSYWKDIRTRTSQDNAGHYYQIDVRTLEDFQTIARQGPFDTQDAARSAGNEQVSATIDAWEGHDDVGEEPSHVERYGFDVPFTVRDEIGNDTTATADRIADSAIERMIERVPQEPAEALLAQAQVFQSEAVVEGGWDNYSTAAYLSANAEQYRLAAACRDPDAPQSPRLAAKQALVSRILDQVTMEVDDEDVGEHTRVRRSDLDRAIGEISAEDVDAILGELESAQRLAPEQAEKLAWDHDVERQHDMHLARQAKAAEQEKQPVREFAHDEDEHEL